MSERDDLEERIESEGVDPKGASRLTDVAQYGNVLVTLWHQPVSPRGVKSYVVRLDRSGDFMPDGSPFEADDWTAARDALRWVMDRLDVLFAFSQLFGCSDEE